MNCPHCASAATTRRQGRTTLGYQRFNCRSCKRRFNERTGTPFNDLQSSERSYQMSGEYLRLFENVLAYCRESVSAGDGMRQQQRRVRYWAAIAILRCLLSSPAAAEVMLEKRAERRERSAAAEDTDVDEVFAAQVLDSVDEEDPSDYVPTAPLDDPEAEFTSNELRRLDGFLRTARGLARSRCRSTFPSKASLYFPLAVAVLGLDAFGPEVRRPREFAP